MSDTERAYHKLTNVDISQQKQLWDERGRGYYGEYLVFRELYPNLPGVGKILMNINIPTSNGRTTEIDLLLIHETGLYVFEMKHYKGTIYGKPHEQYWTQYFRTAPNRRFHSPINQNRYHIEALKKIAPNIPVHSFVVFTNDECNLKVECNEPDITLCTLSSLRDHLNGLTVRPQFLNMDCIDHIFKTILVYSPTAQHPVVVDGKEIPFHEFVSVISANYADQVKKIEAEGYAKINLAQKDCEYEKKRARHRITISTVCAILGALVCIGMSVSYCLSYSKRCEEQIAAAQQELAAFAQKFEEVKDFNNGEIKISKELVTASNIVLEPSSDIENAVSFSCTLVWNGSDYGVSIGEDSALIVILKDGTVKECLIYNEKYPYSSDYHLGGSIRTAGILPHEFYEISVADIAYIKLSNVDIWTYVNYQYKMIASGYEVELYKAE